jgi:hypothetical protein
VEDVPAEIVEPIPTPCMSLKDAEAPIGVTAMTAVMFRATKSRLISF